MNILPSTVVCSGRTSTRLMLAAVLATSLACVPMVSALAQPAPGAPPEKASTLVSTPAKPPKLEGRENAAIAYTALQDVLTREQVQDLEDRYGALDNADLPDAESCKLLHSHGEYIEKILAATRISDCDWGIQYQDGFGALLPYLGHLRRNARLLSFDARRCIAEKDLKEAAERYSALYRMSAHSSRGGCLICSLVGEAIQALACVQVQAQLDAGHLDVESARTIGNAARGIVSDDTQNYLGALKLEEYMGVDWVKGHYTGPDAGAKLVGDITDMMSDGEDAYAEVRKMDGETLSREIEKCRAYYVGVREAWNASDGDERLASLSKDIESGKFGRVTVVLAALEKAHKSMERGKAQLAGTIKNLEAFVRGEYPAAANAKSDAAAK